MKQNKIFYILIYSFLYTTHLIGQNSNVQLAAPDRFELSVGPRFESNLSHSNDLESYSIGGSWGGQIELVNIKSGLGFYVGGKYELVNIGFDRGLNASRAGAYLKLIRVPVGIAYRPTVDFNRNNSFSIRVGISHALINDERNLRIDSEDYNMITGEMAVGYRYVIDGKMGIEPLLSAQYLPIPDETVGNTFLFSFGALLTMLR